MISLFAAKTTAKTKRGRMAQAKEKIKRALIELLDEKDFEKISIQDIVRRARVGRSTYYYHYFEQREVLDDIFNDVFARFCEINKSEITTNTSIEEAGKGLYRMTASMVDYLLANRDFLNTLFFGGVAREFNLGYRRYFEESYAAIHPNDDAYSRYLRDYLCAGQYHLLETLLKNGCEEDRRDMTDLLFDVNCMITLGPTRYHEAAMLERA